MQRSLEIKEARAKAVANAKVIIDSAEGDERELTADEKAQVDALFGEADALAAEAEAAEDAERKAKLADMTAEMRKSTGRKVGPSKVAPTGFTDRERKEAFRAWAMYGTGRVDANTLTRAQAAGINPAVRSMELRALSKATTNAPVPSDFTSEYEKKLKYYFPVMSAISTFATENGNDLPLFVTDDTANTASIVGEAGTIGVTPDPAFSKVTFKAWKYASPIVKCSLEVLQDSVIDLEAYLAEAFGERFGRAYEAAVVSTNAGTTAPQGLLNGVSVGTTLATGNPLTLAKLIALETSVDIAYRSQPGAGWLMHDSTWGQVRQMADTAGFPIFLGDLQNSVQPRLLGYPVFVSNSMTPITTPGTNQPLIAFGCFAKYRWRQVSQRSLVRLDELFASTGEVGYVMLERADGRYMNADAVKTLNSFV